MIPLRDENPSRSAPVVNVAIIALNAAAFVYELMLGPELKPFMYEWGVVPQRLVLALRFHEEPLVWPGLTLFTSMFLHGGWAHLIGNMWYLWIFGDNVEDRLGHVRYLLFYVVGGLVAAGLQVFTALGSELPLVGASGAIAAVLGAYLVMYPRARVITLIPFFPFFHVTALPAVLVLGLWIVFQFFSGALALAWNAAGGVAWWAHIGGFVFGMVLARAIGPDRRPPSRAWVE